MSQKKALLSLSIDQRCMVIKDRIVEIIHESVPDTKGRLEDNTPLFGLGIQSINALEIKVDLEDELDILLENTLLIEYPTVEKLSLFLAKEIEK